MKEKEKLKPAVIKTWEEADIALRELGLRTLHIERIEGRLNHRIAELKQAAVDEAAEHVQARAQIEKGLELFWLERRDEVLPKSRKLNFGALGTRGSRAVRLLRGWTKDKVIHALGVGAAGFLRLRQELDRERVLAASGEELVNLRRYGIGIEERETFFAEPDLARIREREPAA